MREFINLIENDNNGSGVDNGSTDNVVKGNQRWMELSQRIIKMAQEFKDLRSELQFFYDDLIPEGFAIVTNANADSWQDEDHVILNGFKHQAFVRKLRNYPGDITPSMMASLVKDVNAQDTFFKSYPATDEDNAE